MNIAQPSLRKLRHRYSAHSNMINLAAKRLASFPLTEGNQRTRWLKSPPIEASPQTGATEST